MSKQFAGFSKVPFLFGLLEAEAVPGPVLVRLMSDISGSEAAAKATLHRMVTYGLLDLTRHGRVGVYRLAGRMRTGFEAISEGYEHGPWDGRLHLVVFEVPETRRAFRDTLRATMLRNGYRQLRPGVMVSAHDSSRELEGLLREAGAAWGWWEPDASSAAEIAEVCWRVADVAQSYRECIEHLRTVAESDPGEGAEALSSLFESTAEAYALQTSDWHLPRALLPEDWPLAELIRATEQVWESVGGPALAHGKEVAEASTHRALLVPLSGRAS